MSKLTEILEDQLAEAKAKAGTKIIRKLGHGLRIELMQVSNEVQLTLTRDNQYPSMQEFVTVMAHFPYSVEKVTPIPEQKGSRYTVSARLIRSQRPMQMKF